MMLTERDVERLGRDALGVLGLTGTVAVERARQDREFWEVRLSDDETYAAGWVRVEQDGPLAGVVVSLLDYLTNDLSETRRFWGVAFPRCPGHVHPADYRTDEDDVVLTCPTSGLEVVRTAVSR